MAINPAIRQHSIYQQKVLLLILFFFLIRTLLAFTVELGNDESYYWLYSQRLQWNYFDHPPLVAVWIRIFTANLLLQEYPGFVRLGSVAGAALSTWFLFSAVSLFHSPRAGWLTACLYNASFYAGMIAGIFIWPDGPQMLFWTFSLWMMARIAAGERKWWPWILFGAGAGLCIMSKVHGVFLWAGLGIYLLFHKPSWFRLPQLYLAALTTLVIASPILIWNIQHEFVTYKFHSERVAIKESGLMSSYFIEEVAGQFLLNNPFNVILVCMGLTVWKKKEMPRLPPLLIYQYTGLPLISLLLLIAVFRDTYPHWSGPAWVSLLPLAAVRLAELPSGSLYPGLLKFSLGGFLLFILAWPLVVHFYPGSFGNKKGSALGQGDPSLDIYGWKEGGEKFAALYRYEVANGMVPPRTPLISYKWWGAHVEYYFARPAGTTMIGLGPLVETHHYLWMNIRRKDTLDFKNAYCIVPSDEYYNAREKFASFYSRVDSVTSIETIRMNRLVRKFHVYRLSGWKNVLPYVK